MILTKYFLIGKVSIASSWIALILSFFIVYSVVRLKYGKTPAIIIADIIFYFIIVWKLAVILTDFKAILHFPLSIIYFNGGTVGVFLGVFAAAVRVFLEIKNKRMSNQLVMSLLIAVVLIPSMYQIFIAFFNEGPFMIRIITVISFGILVCIPLFFINYFKEAQNLLILLMISLHIFIGALQPAGIFQTPLFVAVVVGSLMMILLFYKGKNDLEVVD